VNGTYNIEDIVILASVKGNIELIINGYFNVSTDGIYTFALLSDDGSTLKVDDDGTTTDRIPRVR
jgi:hexosaminidase